MARLARVVLWEYHTMWRRAEMVGSFVIHPPGTRHSPGSRKGCVALLIYEEFVRFVDTGQ
jgi:hypothetical protein